MTNTEKVKRGMDKWDCVDFYCNHHYCGDCPVYKKDTRKLSCKDRLAAWMEQEAEEDE